MEKIIGKIPNANKWFFTKEELQEMYDRLKSFQKIANEAGCNVKTIHTQAKKLGVKNMHHKEINMDELTKDYNALMSPKQLSEKYGYHEKTFIKLLRDSGVNAIYGKRKFFKYRDIKPTEEQIDILVGSILGDGWIHKHKCDSVRSCRFMEAHAIDQKEYIEWKYNKLKDFISNPMRTRYEGGKETVIQGKKCKVQEQRLFETVFHEIFFSLRQRFYPNGIKIIPKDIKMSPLALAVFYMDDGTYKGKSCILCTQAYDDESLINFIEYMSKEYSIDVKMSSKEKRYKVNGKSLIMNTKESEKFIKIIEPHILKPLFSYKIGL